MKFPYGICDFYKIMTKGYLYIDRTDRIPLIEEAGDQLLFLRPRRFGKSLLLSMLENYYDLARADQFEAIFGKLAIGQNPTPLHNQYFVMKWDFSLVNPQGNAQMIQRSLYNHINSSIDFFSAKYNALLPKSIHLDDQDAIYSFQSLLAAVNLTKHRLYLLIDEYDNFANEVMMGSPSGTNYEELLYGEGMLKTLFKSVKAAAAGRGLDRVFITGVSPIVLSDMTSGYNIVENIYLEPKFNDLCGFQESEITRVIDQIINSCDLPIAKATELLTMIRTFYNGYCFMTGEIQRVYNPTLTFYLLKAFQNHCHYPDNILDDNLAMDRGKLAYIAKIPDGGQLILDAMNDKRPITLTKLVTNFSIADLLKGDQKEDALISMLYFFGILTLAGKTAFQKLVLSIPNQVVRSLYLERIQEMLLSVSISNRETSFATESLFGNGDITPLCTLMETNYFRVFDNRDYRWANELTIKTIFLTLLYNDQLYFIESELELERSYADLVLIRRPDVRHLPLVDILIEFKYISLATLKLNKDRLATFTEVELQALEPVQKTLKVATTMLSQYATVLEKKYGETLRLCQYVVISLGFERLLWQKM